MPVRPEVEDYRVRSTALRSLGRLDAREYLDLLEHNAEDEVESIFGPDLIRHDWNYAVDEHEGSASLGILRVQRRPGLEIDQFGRLTLRLNDRDRPAYLRVGDIRFVEADHSKIRTDLVDDVAKRMRRGVDVLLALGLARAYQAPRDDRQRHWLQVNGICMLDRPLGDQP